MGKITDERVDAAQKELGRHCIYASVATVHAALAAASALTAGEREPVEGCEYCVDGLQADGETPCSCQEVTDTNELLTISYMRGAMDAKRDVASELEALRKERDEARAIQRWNVDDLGNGELHVCRDTHDKGEPCEWEAFVPLFRAETAEARLAEALKALEESRAAILEADPNILTCTLWMPGRISPNETVADYLEAAARRVRDGGQADG